MEKQRDWRAVFNDQKAKINAFMGETQIPQGARRLHGLMIDAFIEENFPFDENAPDDEQLKNACIRRGLIEGAFVTTYAHPETDKA